MFAATVVALATGASGCSCGADDVVVGGDPTICVGPEGGSDCAPDGSELDWGMPAAGAIATLTLRVQNATPTGAPLSISDVRVTDMVNAGRLFDVRLCLPTCDQQVLGLPAQVPAGQTAQLVLTFDATDLDGAVPAESLEIVSNATNDSVEPLGTYVRTFAGVTDGCLPGRTDANMDKGDGCECLPSPDGLEYCDGFDNDCDGVVDEDVQGGNIVCATGMAGECSEGATTCIDGALTCLPNASTVEEVCDGLDNNCDGAIDENNSWEPFNEGLSGGNMSLVEFDPRTTNVAYAVTGSRVYRSDDSGASFALVGEAPAAITALGFPPDDPTMILGASTDGLVRSTDDGVSWSSESLGGFPVVSILVHPADPARIFLGTIGGGVYRSTNGGQSFFAVNQGIQYSSVTSIVGDPLDPDTVVIGLDLINQAGGSSFMGELLRTTNGGTNWVPVQSDIGRISFVSACGADSNIMYAASYQTGVLKSLDAGLTWSVASLAGDVVTGVAVAPSDCNAVYSATNVAGIYGSDDGAATFVGPTLNGLDIQRPGASHFSVHPTMPSRVLLSNHSGVFLSVDAATSWTRTPAIDSANVRALGVSAEAPGVVWMSTWGQGLWKRASFGSDWERNGSLPRDWTISNTPDPFDQQRVVVGAFADVWGSSDAGGTFNVAGGPQNVFAVAFDASNANVIYLGTQLGGVWKSTDGGATYQESNAGLPAPWETGPCTCRDVRGIVVDQADSSRVYAATNLRGLYVSTDAGASWSAAAPSLSGESVECLVQAGSGDLLACVAGEGIWRSTDDGATFTKITQGLPYLNNAKDMHIDSATGDLYVVSDGGVYRSDDDGASWTDMDSQCLPSSGATSPVIVNDQGNRRLLVGTGGVGVYALPLTAPN